MDNLGIEGIRVIELNNNLVNPVCMSLKLKEKKPDRTIIKNKIPKIMRISLTVLCNSFLAAAW